MTEPTRHSDSTRPIPASSMRRRSSLLVWLPLFVLLVVLLVTFFLVPAEKAPFIYQFF